MNLLKWGFERIKEVYPCAKRKGNLVYFAPVELMLAGMYIDRFSSKNQRIPVVFAVPMFGGTGDMHFTYGWRVRNGRGLELWWMDFPDDDEVQKADFVNLVVKRNLPLAYNARTPRGFLDSPLIRAADDFNYIDGAMRAAILCDDKSLAKKLCLQVDKTCAPAAVAGEYDWVIDRCDKMRQIVELYRTDEELAKKRLHEIAEETRLLLKL